MIFEKGVCVTTSNVELKIRSANVYVYPELKVLMFYVLLIVDV